MKKIIAMLMVLLMLSFALMSCQAEQNEQEQNPEVLAPDGDVDTSDVDVNGFQNDRLPEDAELEKLGFAGSTVNILSWDGEEGQTFPKEDSDVDPIKSKLYYHWQGIEERFDITFNTKYTDSSWPGQAAFFTAARADDASYDLIQTQSLFPGTLAAEGRLCNLRNLGYPDLEMPWWPVSVNQWTQSGALYFIAGNSSAMCISNMSVIFVNDGMITSKGAPSPVQSVLRGVWTVEEMTSISKLFAGAAENADEASRIYGLVVDDPSRFDRFYYACGFSSVITDETTGVTTLGYDEEGELQAITEALNKFQALVTGPEVICHPSDDFTEMNEGRTAMLLGYMQYIRTLEKTEEYTVVPLPMLDEKQYDTVGYRTTHRDYTDVWCMPTTTTNKILSGMVLEANASSEYRMVGPFYYEQYLKDRYANGADGRKCFDLLRDSVVYDFGIVSGLSSGGYWRPCFWSSGVNWANTFASDYKSNAGAVATKLQEVLENYAKYVNN